MGRSKLSPNGEVTINKAQATRVRVVAGRAVLICLFAVLGTALLAFGAFAFNGQGTLNLTVNQAASVALSKSEHARLGVAMLRRSAMQAIEVLQEVAAADGPAKESATIALTNIGILLKR